ncbi:MAG: glycosyltransferase [Candidatus Microgenomates bacterium]|jgi:hypothetical protein
MNIFQKYYHKDLQKVYRKFNGIILDNVIDDIPDLQNYFEDLHKKVNHNTRILITYHNPLWEPVLTLASKMDLRKRVGIQNWLDEDDLRNILNLSGFEIINTQKRFFGITTITIAKSRPNDSKVKKDYRVSIIIAARNEEGNILKIIPSIPKFGMSQEIIFIEGHSKDKTWEKISRLRKNYGKLIKIKSFKQKGRGKADAVKLGLSKATGDILMIYDADRTVDAKDLKKFYRVLASGLGEFANGSRLVYPMEKDAMQTLNKIGNQIFSKLFTWILGQRFKDTLCGTKAFWKKDYVKFKHTKTDPFGDFDLIFGAIRNNLKVTEIPVRYKERVYGSTNINRFRHGLLLAKMAFFGFLEFKI